MSRKSHLTVFENAQMAEKSKNEGRQVNGIGNRWRGIKKHSNMWTECRASL
jgi:hypothetical protein